MHRAKQLVIQKNGMWPSKRQDPSASENDFVKFFCEVDILKLNNELFGREIFDQTIGYPIWVTCDTRKPGMVDPVPHLFLFTQ